MRAWWLLGVIAASLVVGGCGEGKKKVHDPSDENTPPKTDDETPKWEGASRVTDTQSSSGSNSSGGGGGATVHEGQARRSDQYDKEATDVELNRAARQVKANCGAAKDDNGKATGPWGKVTIQIMLGHNGHSKEVTVPAPYNDKPVGKCIEKAFTGLSFPPWGGADTQVDKEIELVEPGKEKK